MKFPVRTLCGAVAMTAVALLAGCGDSDSTTSDEATTTTAPAEQASAITVDDAWVKAADTEKTAAFGVLKNSSDEDIVVTAATSDAAGMMELHETVEDGSGAMVMREKDGGFVVPAGGEYLLQPGANHLMLMGLVGPVAAGQEVTISLVLEDGSTADFSATAKEYSGANEQYMEGE